jgi:hypothetical protein
VNRKGKEGIIAGNAMAEKSLIELWFLMKE